MTGELLTSPTVAVRSKLASVLPFDANPAISSTPPEAVEWEVTSYSRYTTPPSTTFTLTSTAASELWSVMSTYPKGRKGERAKGRKGERAKGRKDRRDIARRRNGTGRGASAPRP